jgi:hypothetical protein
VSAMRTRRALIVTLMAGLAALASAAHAATPDFVADDAVRQAAEASAADAVAIAKRQFKLQLDGSEASIDDVERALVALNAAYAIASPKPPDDQLMPMARAFGAYVGEVYRKNHGATWGTVTLNGNRYPGFRTAGGVNVWPVGRVLNVITDGPDNDIAYFYRKLVAGPARD